ncbi:hypothetical protein VD0002_g6644 [Verticillium dahliae]|uniref:Uncharacterized protein n=1 Tax=Verticillium dahliae TaxID=27337 RepID=A0AA44W7N6_VERDA|nr:hypothetical protein BJF96_g10306 [Verticillium dahliae]PNH49347.1 hypothetical protein VD0003_g7779 [Verticillium dahliae]PNH61100.1 hypothetical protein VD0002_g6644 [Verticillium dahliae]
MLSVAELMGRYPVVEMDAGLLEGDWLWEDNFANWPGMALPRTSKSTPQAE